MFVFPLWRYHLEGGILTLISERKGNDERREYVIMLMVPFRLRHMIFQT